MESRTTRIVDCIGDCRGSSTHAKFANSLGLYCTRNRILLLNHQYFDVRNVAIDRNVILGEVAIDEMAIERVEK